MGPGGPPPGDLDFALLATLYSFAHATDTVQMSRDLFYHAESRHYIVTNL